MIRILFLDVDGPLIPSGMYMINRHCSFERKCSPICVAIVNKLCEKAGAKIVFNSTHNRDGGIALADFVREGIELNHIHERPMTGYPGSYSGRAARWWAIQDWIKQEKDQVEWLAFDDDPFTTDKRLILVDFDVGITVSHYNRASELWKLNPFLVY